MYHYCPNCRCTRRFRITGIYTDQRGRRWEARCCCVCGHEKVYAVG